MARTSLMAASSSLMVLLLLVVPSVFGTDHTVGDNSGWTQGENYTDWASKNTFNVNDNLVFTYGSTHSVDEVKEDDYNSCTAGNALKSYSGGSTKIALTAAGKRYFICPTAGHCSGGMKLAVNVVAAGTTPTTPTTPSTPNSPSTPSTPSSNPSPPPPSGSGAVAGLGGVKELMGSLVVSLLILALMC